MQCVNIEHEPRLEKCIFEPNGKGVMHRGQETVVDAGEQFAWRKESPNRKVGITKKREKRDGYLGEFCNLKETVRHHIMIPNMAEETHLCYQVSNFCTVGCSVLISWLRLSAPYFRAPWSPALYSHQPLFPLLPHWSFSFLHSQSHSACKPSWLLANPSDCPGSHLWKEFAVLR